jgi:hypothetical protein
MLATGDFSDPETRIPFAEAELKEIDEFVSTNRSPYLLAALYSYTHNNILFRPSNMVYKKNLFWKQRKILIRSLILNFVVMHFKVIFILIGYTSSL